MDEKELDFAAALEEYEETSDRAEMPVCAHASSSYELMQQMGVLDALDLEEEHVRTEGIKEEVEG